ncbi:MAG: hypothetical protein NVSMB9_22380 [Isosphaeraceae bacterium]
MSSIDQNRQSYPRGPPEVANRVQRRADRSTREENVIHQDDLCPIDVEGNLGPAQDWPPVPLIEVIAVQGDVHGPHWNVRTDQGLKGAGDPASDGEPAGPDPDQT